MNFRQQLRKDFLIVLKHTLNPVTRRLARSSFGPFSIVRHVGRRSGKVYETPIIVSRVEDGFVIELTYRPNVDWHKNVLAAGGCTLIWHGQEYAIDKIGSPAILLNRRPTGSSDVMAEDVCYEQEDYPHARSTARIPSVGAAT